MTFTIANRDGGLFAQVACLLDFSAGVNMTYVAPRISAHLERPAFIPRIAAAPFHDFPAGMAIRPFGNRGWRLRHALHERTFVNERKMPLLARRGLSQSANRENQFNEAHRRLLR